MSYEEEDTFVRQYGVGTVLMNTLGGTTTPPALPTLSFSTLSKINHNINIIYKNSSNLIKIF